MAMNFFKHSSEIFQFSDLRYCTPASDVDYYYFFPALLPSSLSDAAKRVPHITSEHMLAK